VRPPPPSVTHSTRSGFGAHTTMQGAWAVAGGGACGSRATWGASLAWRARPPPPPRLPKHPAAHRCATRDRCRVADPLQNPENPENQTLPACAQVKVEDFSSYIGRLQTPRELMIMMVRRLPPRMVPGSRKSAAPPMETDCHLEPRPGVPAHDGAG